MPDVAGSGDRDDDARSASTEDSFLREVAHAPSPPPRLNLSAGSLIAGRFRLERSLGEGGMGVVWQAVHSVTRKPVALKFLKRGAEDARAVQRFLREARAACAVRHPSVVEVHDVIELEDGSPVMVMDLLTGETLAQRLARERSLSLPEMARIMVHVCSAVGCAHALGIVHRDLKPENIFLAESASGLDVRVLDFGIAKLTASEGAAAQTATTGTGTGAILGTPYYMAPEQLFGEKDVDLRADIWALGVIFYETLCGVRPTEASNMGQIYKVVMTDAIVPLRQRAPHLPDAIVDLVSRMTSRDRTKRPSDVREVLVVLAGWTNESFTTVDPPRMPTVHERDSVTTPQQGHVDSDTARASTVEEAPSVRERAKPRWRTPVVIGAVVVGLAITGTLALRAPSQSTTTEVAPATTTPPKAQPVEPPVPTQPAVPAIASESMPSASAAASASSTPTKHAAAAKPTAARTAGPTPSAPAAPTRPVVDPASYQ